jgi:hypothetical protein
VRSVAVSGRIRLEVRTALERQSEGTRFRNGAVRVLDSHIAYDSVAVGLSGDGKRRDESAVARHQIAFPAGIDDRVPEPHEKAVAGISGCQRVVTAAAEVEVADRLLIAAVVDGIEDLVVAFGEVDRLEDHEW